MFSILPLLLVLIPQSGPPTDGLPPVKDQVRVLLRGPVEADLLRQVASDFDDHRPLGADGSAVVYADDAEQARLAAMGFQLLVEIEDLSGFYSARAQADLAGRSAAGGSMGGFKTLAEILAEMDRLTATYPALVSPRFSIGTSGEGRAIWAQRISDNPGVDEAGEPVAWFDALHHAREPMSGESLLLFADWLLTRYGSDPLATRLIDSRNIMIVPCVNPDGYEYNRQIASNGGGMWRKNRRNNGGGVYGVDLNRNYGWEWGSQWSGSSSDPSSDVYRGPSAFSEPETRACRDRLALHPPGMSISAHTYSDLWLYSWGYTTILTSENAIFRAYGARMTQGNGWPYGTVWELLYTANGGSVDWHYGAHGTYAFTPEIGSDSDGFWPAPSRIPALFQDALPGYLMTAMWTGGYAEKSGQALTEVSGDGDAWPEPGETWGLALDFENYGTQAIALTLDLISNDAAVTVVAGSASANLGVRSSGTAGGLRLRFESSAETGRPYILDLDTTWDGVTTTETVEIVLGQPRVLFHDDMETPGFGWTTTTTGANYGFERAVPQATSSGGQALQPGTDSPAGSGVNCWVTGAAAGSGAGTNDVDGTTTLTSPRFDGSAFSWLELGYARWFANLPGGPLDDHMLVEVSNDDGATWTTLENTGNANSWSTVAVSLTDRIVPTARMRLRFTVADSPNDDLTEGCVDDLELRTISSLPTLGAFGDPALGGSMRLRLEGPANKSFRLARSFSAGSGRTIGGIAGLLYLRGNIADVANGSTAGNGSAVIAATIPNDPALAGRTIYLQAAFDLGGAQAALSNLLTLVLG
ncbi:MAG TPA: M14 family metallopeptidase [Planctomycetota bacterium]